MSYSWCKQLKHHCRDVKCHESLVNCQVRYCSLVCYRSPASLTSKKLPSHADSDDYRWVWSQDGNNSDAPHRTLALAETTPADIPSTLPPRSPLIVNIPQGFQSSYICIRICDLMDIFQCLLGCDADEDLDVVFGLICSDRCLALTGLPGARWRGKSTQPGPFHVRFHVGMAQFFFVTLWCPTTSAFEGQRSLTGFSMMFFLAYDEEFVVVK